MASYEVQLRPAAERELRKLPQQVLSRLAQQIASLAQDPFPAQSKQLSSEERLFRLRVGDYRVVYGVDRSADVVTVHHVRHRRDVYRKLP